MDLSPHPSRRGSARFDIDRAMRLLEEAVRPFPKAAMFELFESGHRSIFEQIVACMISVRTLDEVSAVAARRLFARASLPDDVAKLSVDEITRLIVPATFARSKAPRIRAIASEIASSGNTPRTYEDLTALPGIGPKCAALVLGVTGTAARVSVDTHVHRVTNRWGYVATSSPEKTMVALEAKLPKRHWVAINRLLVPFGKHVCTHAVPRCSTCPLRAMCARVGVTKSK